jgi:hypothetical protein
VAGGAVVLTPVLVLEFELELVDWVLVFELLPDLQAITKTRKARNAVIARVRE